MAERIPGAEVGPKGDWLDVRLGADDDLQREVSVHRMRDDTRWTDRPVAVFTVLWVPRRWAGRPGCERLQRLPCQVTFDDLPWPSTLRPGTPSGDAVTALVDEQIRPLLVAVAHSRALAELLLDGVTHLRGHELNEFFGGLNRYLRVSHAVIAAVSIGDEDLLARAEAAAAAAWGVVDARHFTAAVRHEVIRRADGTALHPLRRGIYWRGDGITEPTVVDLDDAGRPIRPGPAMAAAGQFARAVERDVAWDDWWQQASGDIRNLDIVARLDQDRPLRVSRTTTGIRVTLRGGDREALAGATRTDAMVDAVAALLREGLTLAGRKAGIGEPPPPLPDPEAAPSRPDFVDDEDDDLDVGEIVLEFHGSGDLTDPEDWLRELRRVAQGLLDLPRPLPVESREFLALCDDVVFLWMAAEDEVKAALPASVRQIVDQLYRWSEDLPVRPRDDVGREEYEERGLALARSAVS